jgi:hypothetical protein
VKPTSSETNAPSPENAISPPPPPGCPGLAGSDGGRNGSPHSAQKKCCSWYVRFPSCGSSSEMKRSSTIAVLQV